MQKYIVLLPHYEKALDADVLIKKFTESSWKISRREYSKRNVKYFRFTKDYDKNGYIFSVNVFLFPKINLFIYIFNLKSVIGAKDKEIIKTTELFKSIAKDELSIEEYLPERLLPFFVESYSIDEISSFGEAKSKLLNNCYFHEDNNANELYLGYDSITKIEILLVKTSLHEYFCDAVLKKMILVKSLKEYSDELSRLLSDVDVSDNKKLEIYTFIWNYLLYIDKSSVNGIFRQYLNLSLKPLERLLEYREHNNSKNIINILESIHTAEKVLLTLTLVVIVDIISQFSKHSNFLTPYSNEIFPALKSYYADFLIIIIIFVMIFITIKYFKKIFWE